MNRDHLQSLAQGVVAEGQFELAVRAVRAMGDLLGKAHILHESIDCAGEGGDFISITNCPLSLQFGKYVAKVCVVDNSLSLQGHESDGDDPEIGVRLGHMGISIRVDVEYEA